MPPPAFIELKIPEGRRIYLIFQSKQQPLLDDELRRGQVWVNRCPDDGALFLEGSPADYVGRTVNLDPRNNDSLFKLSADMLIAMDAAKDCAFGEVGSGQEGGNGPGFTYDGEVFRHDYDLGISSEPSESQESIAAQPSIVVLIDRLNEHALQRYYDEQNPLSEKGPKPGEQQNLGGEEDVDMEGQVQADGESSTFADELTSRMRTLRLKGQ